jgi:hypothetical protein
VLDCAGMVVMPGLVQAHVHLCQTLARGHADDLELLDWLAKVIWPYEAALDAPAMGAAARSAAPSCCSAAPRRSSTWARCTTTTRCSRSPSAPAAPHWRQGHDGRRRPAHPGRPARADLALARRVRAAHRALARRRRRAPALRVRAALRPVVHRGAAARGRPPRRGAGAWPAHPHPRQREPGRARRGPAPAQRRQPRLPGEPGHRRPALHDRALHPRRRARPCRLAADGTHV